MRLFCCRMMLGGLFSDRRQLFELVHRHRLSHQYHLEVGDLEIRQLIFYKIGCQAYLSLS